VEAIDYAALSKIRWGLPHRMAAFAVRQAAKRFLALHPADAPLPAAPDARPRLLYVHVPFCHTLCPYCSFHKFPFHEATAERYFALLHEEMRMVHALGYRFDALYVGGGTTTILPAALQETIALARRLFEISEVSCESDPRHLGDLEPGSVERLSVGVQSFDDRHLRQIGRFTKFGSGAQQYAKVAAALGDFPVVNVDMIYNLPEQSEAELQSDLETILRLRPQQVTFYPLMYAPGVGSKLTRLWGALSDAKEACFYRIIMERMGNGYTQRSAWAWSLEERGMIDEYIVERSEYVGIGSGAFSFIGDTLYANTFSLPEYAERIRAGRTGVTHAVSFPSRAILQYRMMVELFGMQRPHVPLWPEQLFLRLSGAWEKERLTPAGAHLLSVMMREFYNGMDRVRETMRRSLTPEDGFIR